MFCNIVIQLCKSALVLSTHHLRVWLDIAYSTGVKSYYYPDSVYLHRLGALQLLHDCITILQNIFSRWNLKMASVRPKHVVSNFFISWFLVITSIRKLLVVLLTVSPYQHLVYYTMGMANLKISLTYLVRLTCVLAISDSKATENVPVRMWWWRVYNVFKYKLA